ncbi:MAG: prenyltransferase, partial [Microbacterium sp.]
APGPASTPPVAMALWALAGLLTLLTPPPALLSALAAVPYLVAVARYARVSDARSATANRAWRRFLVINYAVGFALTLLLILCAAEGLFS